MTLSTRIHWRFDHERRFPFGTTSPDPERHEMIGFPPPWPDRPWIYGVMVASANGVVSWRREGPHDDPVLAVLGGDPTSPQRLADLRQMRFYRIFGDCAVGAETHRQQPGLVQTPREPGEPPVPALCYFRAEHGLRHHPRNVIYSLYGRIDLDDRVFRTPDLDVIVVTLPVGAASLETRGARTRGIELIVESDLLQGGGLRRAHERLFADHGVRYLDCEGGETILQALHGAGLLDEVFVTTTDTVVDESRHQGVIRIMDFACEGATLIAEGATDAPGGFVFRRWRFDRSPDRERAAPARRDDVPVSARAGATRSRGTGR